MKKVVIFHAVCYDGLVSAWVAWTKFKHTAEYIPGFYAAPIPIFNAPTHIYIVDFSFSVEVISSWVSAGHKVTILDHHQTAIDALAPYFKANDHNKNLEAVFDNERSGAGITYNYFYPGKELPKMIQYVQDRDLWKFKFGNTSRYLYSYMQLRIEFNDPLAKQFEVVDMINESLQDPNSYVILEKGQVLSEAYYKFCRDMAANRVNVKAPDWMGGMVFPVLTTNKMFGSDTCSYIVKEFNTQAAGYFFLEKPNQWNWGMRSIGEINVAELCQRYGGGGHKNAAGFILKSASPFPSDWVIIDEEKGGAWHTRK